MNEQKYCIKHKSSNGTYLAILNSGWRYDGSMIIEANSSLELEAKLNEARYDDRWVTMEGNHVLIGGNGLIKAGAGGRLTGRKFGMRFRDYEHGHISKKGKRMIRQYNITGKKNGEKRAIGGAKVKQSVEMKKQAVDTIMATHKGLLKPEHMKELKSIVENNMTPEEAKFYGILTSKKARYNSYYEKGTGYYSPMFDKVRMDMNENSWAKDAGLNYKSGVSTKFHEEFHQLDSALDYKFGKTDTGAIRCLTHPDTPSGKKLSAAIEKDVVNFFNAAIDEANAFTSSNMKHVKSTNRITKEQKAVIRNYLYSFPPKELAQIHILTDAIGLQTNGNVDIGMKGVWRHSTSYNKERGKEGATSETWASFSTYKFVSDKDGQKTMEEYMPNTIKACNEVLSEVVSYVNENGIY